MQSITTIGLDIAKSVFQVHGVDAAGQVVMRRQLKRRYVLKFFEKLPPCLVGIEACASSHRKSERARLAHGIIVDDDDRGGTFAAVGFLSASDTVGALVHAHSPLILLARADEVIECGSLWRYL
jgi:hypothetical protein